MRMIGARWIPLLVCGVIAGACLAAPGFGAEVSAKTSSAETIEEIDQQLQSDPWSEILLRKKVLLQFKDKNYWAVIATVKPLLTRNPNSFLALEATAKSYSRLKDYGRAIDYLNRLIELSPTYENIILRGSCRLRVGLYDEALRDNNWCIKLCPGDGRSYLLRAEIYRCQVGIDEQFEKYINKAIELSPDNPAVQLDLANASKLIREMERKKEGQSDSYRNNHKLGTLEN